MSDLKVGDFRNEDGSITRANGSRFGCIVDGLEYEGEDFFACVAMEEDPKDCIYGHFRNGRERKSRWTCKYWAKLPPSDD